MALMEFSMVPLDRGPRFSPYVARVLEVVAGSGLPYRLHAMGTVVEGEWDELVALLTACQRALAEVSDRISVSAKFDVRKGVTGALEDKVRKVEAEAGRSFST
jgi:uncharacterized protein (TIGR00106 family)